MTKKTLFLRKTEVYRWFIWGVLLLLYLIAVLHRFSLGLIKDDINGSFDLSAAAFASLGSMYFYAYLVMQIPTGILVDTFGVRRTVTCGMLLAGAGAILFGFSQNVYLLFAGRLFVGLGVSVVFISLLKILSKWYDEKEFATMSGLSTFIGSAGAMLSQTPFVLLVAVFTWRYTLIMIGVVTCLLAALCYAVVRNKPEDMGFEPLQECTADSNTGKPEDINIINALIQILKNPHTWPPFIMFAGVLGAYQTFAGTWGQSFLMDVYGFKKITAANYMLIVFIGAAIGCAIIGKLSDMLSRRKAVLLAIGGLAPLAWSLFIFLYKGKPPAGTLAVILFLIGFTESVTTLAWACGKEVNDPRYAGISTSVINLGGFIGAALIPVFSGMVIDRYKNVLDAQQLYSRAFLCCLAGIAVAFASTLFIKETGCRNIHHTVLNKNIHKVGKVMENSPGLSHGDNIL